MIDLERGIRTLIDDVREGRTLLGVITFPWTSVATPDSITVGLARFQSYRARTEAALVQEIVDLVEESDAQQLTYEVLAESGTVRLEV